MANKGQGNQQQQNERLSVYSCELYAQFVEHYTNLSSQNYIFVIYNQIRSFEKIYHKNNYESQLVFKWLLFNAIFSRQHHHWIAIFSVQNNKIMLYSVENVMN